MTFIHRYQRGSTLVIALVILVMMTILTISAFNMGKSSLEIVGNMQQRAQTTDAARGVLELVYSSPTFLSNPSAAIVGTCNNNTVANKECIDFNGDNITDAEVNLTPSPTCVSARVVLNSELNLASTDDQACIVSANPNQAGIAGANNSSNSLCGDSVWEITAVASDSISGAQSTVSTGAAVRTSIDNISTSCP